jgi:cytochrome c biogenesis protein ResB
MVTLELWPDLRAFARLQLTGEPTPMLVAFDPYIRYSVHVGEIVDPALGTVNTTGLRRVGGGGLRAADTSAFDVPGVGELELTFPELRQYSVLLVSRDVGIPVVLAAAILVLVGLIPSLYVSRRKVWARAEAVPGGSLLKVGGFALQRKEAFEEEFDRLVRSLGSAVNAAGTRPPQFVGSP